MMCRECMKGNMRKAYNMHFVYSEKGRRVFFPMSLWIPTSLRTFKEHDVYICDKCGAVKAAYSGRTYINEPEFDGNTILDYREEDC